MKRRLSPSVSHHQALLRRLRDPGYAAKYLSACLEDSEDAFLLGLRQVAQARGGLRKLAGETRLNREHLFRMLSAAGNPEFHSLRNIIARLGLKWAVRPA